MTIQKIAYVAFFVNTKTGKLFLSRNINDNPTGTDWKRVSASEFELLEKVHSYSYHGWYNIETSL